MQIVATLCSIPGLGKSEEGEDGMLISFACFEAKIKNENSHRHGVLNFVVLRRNNDTVSTLQRKKAYLLLQAFFSNGILNNHIIRRGQLC